MAKGTRVAVAAPADDEWPVMALLFGKLIAVKRLSRVIAGIGYPPVVMTTRGSSPSAHFRWDNDHYAALIIAGLEKE